MRKVDVGRLLLVFALCSLVVRPAAADPVVDFLVEADSLIATGDEDAVGAFVEREALIVGAAVGRLLDIAFEIAGEDPDAARENVALARRIADADRTSDVPSSLVDTYEEWTEAQRATKARAIALEADAAVARQDGDAARDVELLREAEALYASIGDRRAVAINRGTQGVAHWYAGDWAEVEASYGRALEARRAIEDRILEGRTLNGLGSAHFQQARYEEALVWYGRAIELRERTGDAVGLATSLTYASNCEQALDRLARARRLLERALPVLEGSGDAKRRLEALHSVGVLYRETGRVADAVRTLEEAVAALDAAPEYEAGIRLDLAAALRIQGRVREAREEIGRAAEAAGDVPEPGFAFRLAIERGLAVLALGDLDRAEQELDAARELARDLEVAEWEALAEASLANVLIEAGRTDTAYRTARRALDRAREAGSLRYELLATQTAADALQRMERHDESLALVDSVTSRHADATDGLLTNLRVTRGNALAALGRYADARREFRAVRRSVIENGRGELAWIPTVGIGDTFESLAPDSARAYYDRAFASLERHRAATASGAVQTSFLADQRGRLYQEITHFYASLVDRRGTAPWSALAFRTAERARARGLYELVTRAVDTDDDPEIAALLERLYAIDEADAVQADERQAIQDELARRFDAKLAARAPWAAGQDSIPGPDALGRALDDDTVALVYAVGEDATWLWAIDRTGHELHRLPGRTALQERVVALREALLTPGFGDRALGAEAHALYRTLIAPVASRLRERIWIVPDGVLFEIPFEVLLAEEPGDRPDWRRADYLARDRRIGYAPSAQLLLTLRDRTAAGSGRLLALGDPDFGTLAVRAGTTEALPPLPQSRAEVEALVELRQDATVTLLGDAATETGLRRGLASASPSIVHLATHGLVDREEPSLTSVALGRDPASAEDGYLYTLEILALPLDAELVVLSACDTGRGKLERGEGTIGLTRSFLAAGARRVVASLWPVADASTSRLMQTFYEELLEAQRPVDEALRRARARLWSERETAHPYFWAPFVLMGSDAPLPPESLSAPRD